MEHLRWLIRFLLRLIGLITVIVLVLGLLSVPLMPRLLHVQDAPQKADYIVPLAGEWHRYLKAAELYKAGYAPTILLSNSRIPEPTRFQKLREEMGVPQADPRELRRKALTHLGVPEEALASFGEGHISTIEEAEALRDFLKGAQVRVILVTSPYHARRARIVFTDTMPRATFLVTSPPERALTKRWWTDQKSAQRVVLEVFKLIYYYIGGGFRASEAE